MRKDVKDLINQKRNVFLFGPGGTGKTKCIKDILLYLHDLGYRRKHVACTATTGIAAFNIKHNLDDKISFSIRTFHSWSGIGLGKQDADYLYTKCAKQSGILWKTIKILIIDEISMFGKKLFEKMDYVARAIRLNNEPFGGIQVIVSGDFLQLPPVNDEWIFKSKAFLSLQLQMVKFTTPHRFISSLQKDGDLGIIWYEMLSRIRVGEHTEEDIAFLQTRHQAYKSYKKRKEIDIFKIKPTVLYSKKVDVKRENKKNMRRLDGPSVFFDASDEFVPSSKCKDSEKSEEVLKTLAEMAFPESIEMRVGAQVILKFNICVETGLVNGSRGVVTGINKDGCYVKFMHKNDSVFIPSTEMKFYEKEHGHFTRNQVPLKLAYASTIHSCQGLSLDCAAVDLGRSIFSPGQAYVALSRVRNPIGLYLIDFDSKKIFADQEVIEYIK